MAPVSTPPKKQPIPFGKYLLLDRINIGGMAEVWRGKQFGASGFERLVAIKRILPNIAEDEEFITMFIDEAKISVQLTHANIAQIYELGQIQSSYFIAMEYIPGKDMRAIFERCRKKAEPAPIPLTCYVIAKLCEGLDYAHRKKDGMGRDMNIVHRDVSPQNVLISYEGEVKVIDFGIAKAAGKATKTQAGILKGKFGYMSPEQIRGLPLDRRSDVFAIGVCLYEMLTGERLFVGESDFSVLEKVRKAEVLPPSTYNRRVPETLERIVLKSLARDVDERYQYASELADDLQRFLITSDSIFSRKDLMQYMKSTFAEEVEREKIRIQEYADIKAPPELLQDDPPPSASAARSIPPSLSSAPPRSTPVPPTVAPSLAASPLAPTAPVSNREVVAPLPARKGASLSALPKLTAAAAASVDLPEDNATIISEGKPQGDAPPPSAAPLPKLTAAAAQPTNLDSNASTVLAAGPDETTGPIDDPDPEGLERTLPPQNKLRAAPAAAPSPGRLPPPPSVSPQRVPVGRQETDPGLELPPEVPTSPQLGGARNSPRVGEPPMLRPAGESGAPPVLRPAGEGPSDSLPSPRSAIPELRPSDRSPPVLAPRSSGPGPDMDARFRSSRPPPSNPFPPRSGGFSGQPDPDDLAAIRGSKRLPFIIGGAVIGVLVLVAGLFMLLRGPSKGMIVVTVSPPEMQSKAHLYINGEDRGIPKYPAFQEAPVGPAVVAVVVEGYEPFTRTVEVREVKGGVDIPTCPAVFGKPSAKLVVLTDPADAEIRVDGATVRKEGTSDIYLGEIPAGTSKKVEAYKTGYKPAQQSVTGQGDASAPLQLKLKLERLDPSTVPVSVAVTSDPSGATVSANGRQLGTTPMTFRWNGDVQMVTLSKRCYETVELAVQPPTGSSPVELRGELRKQPGCR